jgi:GR25 family glycosyltransferase involved in LPS biosynthesis
MLNDIFDRVVVINLDSRPDRLEQFDAQAKKFGIKYDRISAVPADPPKLPATWACKESHLSVMKQAIKDGVKRLFVFEDDALFDTEFDTKFPLFYKELPEDWDMLYLGAWHIVNEPYKEGIVKMIESYSAHAYGINEHYMQEALSAAYKPNPIDIALAKKHPHIKAYCAKPALVGQTPGYSDIEREYRDVTEHYR